MIALNHKNVIRISIVPSYCILHTLAWNFILSHFRLKWNSFSMIHLQTRLWYKVHRLLRAVDIITYDGMKRLALNEPNGIQLKAATIKLWKHFKC